MTLQSRVSILGLGNMGAALARALMRRGHDVVVWNRTADRAAPIVAEGAVPAASPAAAIAASPVSIMCLIDHSAANAVLDSDGVAAALAGKTFAQLTSTLPTEVTDQAAWVKRCGARFLAGGIMVFPSSIGRPDASIVYAGDSSAFADHRAVFTNLAGSSQYLGEDPRVAVGAYCTAGIYALGSIAMFLETAALARHYGLSIDTYYGLARASADVVFDRVRDSADRIATGRLDGDEASVDVILSAMHGFCAAFAQTGIDARMTRAFTAHLQAASAAGNGEKDMASIAESLWTARGTAGSAAGALRGHADPLCDSESGRVESEKELMLAADERFRQASQRAEITARLTDAFTSQPQFMEPPGADESPADFMKIEQVEAELRLVLDGVEAAFARGATPAELMPMWYDKEIIVVGEGDAHAARGFEALLARAETMVQELGSRPNVRFKIDPSVLFAANSAIVLIDVTVSPDLPDMAPANYRMMTAWHSTDRGWRIVREMFAIGEL